MTLELIAIIASSSVIVAVLPLIIKSWQEANFTSKNKYERAADARAALVTSLAKLSVHWNEENGPDKEVQFAEAISHYISWENAIIFCGPSVYPELKARLDENILGSLRGGGRGMLAKVMNEKGDELVNEIRFLTPFRRRRSRLPMFLIYVSIGVISGLISAALLLYWAGYTWHY